jgi:hypothetical protein
VIKPPERVELPEDGPKESFARVLAVAIVVGTLGLALVEFAHGIDSNQSDAAGIAAQRLGVERQGASVRGRELVQTEIDLLQMSELERARSANASQDLVTGPSGASGAAAAADQQRWDSLANLTATLTSIREDAPDGPVQDLSFPNNALSEAARESLRLFALQDAANQERQAWESRLSQYFVIATLLAVAIYLLGLSLTMSPVVRRPMAGLALLMVTVAAVWGSALQLQRPVRAPDQAASLYADGMVADARARSHADLVAADRLLSQAISERPDFAEAYAVRSVVRLQEGSPEARSQLLSISTPEALRRERTDAQKAYDLGLRTYLVLNNLAAADLLVGVEGGRDDLVRQSLPLLAETSSLDPGFPLPYANTGLAELVLGDRAAARSAYDQAIDRVLFTGSDHHRRNDAYYTEQQVAGWLTPLDLIARHRPGLAGAVLSTKEHLVAAMQGRGLADAGTVSGAALQVFSSHLQWTARIDDVDLAHDVISIQWYHDDPSDLGWTAIGYASGVRVPGRNGAAGADAYFLQEPLLAETTDCAAPGRYRAEVYLNGKLWATPVADADPSPVRPLVSRSLGLAVCGPESWQQDSAAFRRGFADFYRSPDARSGLAVFRVQNPSSGAASGGLSPRDAYLADFLGYGSPVPTGLVVDTTQSAVQYFLGLKDPAVRYYRNPDGTTALVGAGTDTDGSIIVGLVYGPAAGFLNASSQKIFDSMLLT